MSEIKLSKLFTFPKKAKSNLTKKLVKLAEGMHHVIRLEN